MGHHHHHHPENLKDEKASENLTFHQKATMLLHHWIHHNEEHAGSYRQWAEEFRNKEFTAVAALLEAAAELTLQINHTLREADRQLDRQGDKEP